MKVVIDCNVLVSAARSGGVCGRVVVEAMRHHEVVLSQAIVDEYELVAGRRRTPAIAMCCVSSCQRSNKLPSSSSRKMSHLDCATPMTKSIWRLQVLVTQL